MTWLRIRAGISNKGGGRQRESWQLSTPKAGRGSTPHGNKRELISAASAAAFPTGRLALNYSRKSATSALLCPTASARLSFPSKSASGTGPICRDGSSRIRCFATTGWALSFPACGIRNGGAAGSPDWGSGARACAVMTRAGLEPSSAAVTAKPTRPAADATARRHARRQGTTADCRRF